MTDREVLLEMLKRTKVGIRSESDLDLVVVVEAGIGGSRDGLIQIFFDHDGALNGIHWCD